MSPSYFRLRRQLNVKCLSCLFSSFNIKYRFLNRISLSLDFHTFSHIHVLIYSLAGLMEKRVLLGKAM